ncbi:mitochondrial carrier domain-containing protein [Gilbertella persicaria]|uniref:mitochondrial carrier domain-containing protein n=1 Tax=Gilbertella persicaria TaxID=101096 RepID=UPI00221FAEB6|nr:mitochondrial carrier domain-containing protein [Gilbertella persicaria]KAI8048932.1 mitochondrial carrier domain-containing protein [Gilbertella persicaria]
MSDSKIPLYSNKYFLACTVGVKPGLYKGVFDGWRTIVKAEGMRGIFTGIGPTAIGYSLQGAGKYGFYEIFKYKYANLVGEENAKKYKTFLFLGASASAELIADVLLCPMEALKVRMQTSIPPYAKTTREGFNKIMATEGINGFYKGLVPLWSRQVPYTMVKFASFEKTVEYLYKTFMTKPKEEYNKVQQLGVSFAGGYIAGVFCAAVSHPADVLVSKLNNLPKPAPGEKQAGAMDVVKKLGFRGLWTGLGPRIVMIGTLTGLQWLIYDTFKVSVGLPTTGSH